MQDPALASTGSASAYMVAGAILTHPPNKPFPEPVEGNTAVSPDPAMASTGSASARVVDGTTLTSPTNKPLPEPVEGCGVQQERNQVEALPEPVEGNTAVSPDPAAASTDPAAASTGSASACMVDGATLTQPPNKPLPEPVEGCGVQEERNQVEALPEPVAPFPEPVEGNTAVSPDPAMASTGSASAYVVDGITLTPPTNKPLPEPVEGCGVQEERNQVEALPEPVAPFPEPVEGNTAVS
ncbi:MAG: hypothetical protein R6X34_15015, partial [Chloroflexota bacterium]